jgi:hypothetical protein
LSAERRAGALSDDGLAGCEHIRDPRHVAVASSWCRCRERTTDRARYH